jgi:hypothetical protein
MIEIIGSETQSDGAPSPVNAVRFCGQDLQD